MEAVAKMLPTVAFWRDGRKSTNRDLKGVFGVDMISTFGNMDYLQHSPSIEGT